MENITRIYHGLPAVLVDDHWVVISSKFDEIARIAVNQIDDAGTYEELLGRSFFQSSVRESGSRVSLVTLITTSDCNLRCSYCFANSGESCRVMSSDIAFAAVRRALENSSGRKLSVAFFGGEPTLTQGLIRAVVDYATTESGKIGTEVEFSITTNGVVNPSFLQFLIERQFLFTVSVDGPPDIQDYQRPLKSGGPSSAHVARTIESLVQGGANFKLRATVTEYSVGKMAEMVAWAGLLGVKEIHFEPLSVAGRAALVTKGVGLDRPKLQEFIAGLKSAIIMGNQSGVGVVNSAFMNLASGGNSFCDGDSKYRFAITYDGQVTTCVEVQDRCHPVAAEFMVGGYDPVRGVIDSTKSRGRACLVNIRKEESACVSCFASSVCGGGCPVRNFHTTGDSGKVDPYRCALVKEMLVFAYDLLDKESE